MRARCSLAGLVDDVRHLSPVAKLAAQFAAAGIAIAAGLRVELSANDALGVVIAFVWLVGITNAFNLLDNMDGLAATLATVACIYFAVDAATVHENDLVLVLSLALAFACLGFLPFNLRPGGGARVFMGDAGSQLLGFLLAALGLASSWTTAGTTVATMLLPLLVLAIPILDTTLVTVRRLAERRPVTQGGRDHTSHRLVYYGLSETRAVALLALIAVALGATSVAYNVLDRPAITALGVLVTLRAPRPVRQLPLRALGARAAGPSGRHAAAPRARRAAAAARRARRRRRDRRRDVPRRRTSCSSTVAARSSSAARSSPRFPSSSARPTSSYVLVRASTGARGDTRRPGISSTIAARVGRGDARCARDRRRDPRSRGLPARRLCSSTASSRRSSRVRRAGSSASCPRRAAARTTAGAGSSSSAPARRAEASRATCASADEAHVVGFLDDNPRLRRRRLQGVPVLGTTDDVEPACSRRAGRTSSSSRSPTRPPTGSSCSRRHVTRPASRGGSCASARPARRPRRHGRSPSERDARPRRSRARRRSPRARARRERCCRCSARTSCWRRSTRGRRGGARRRRSSRDELELTQISRAIADTGEPARRGEPYGFSSLVPWLTAPFWWLEPVSSAYEAIKTVQAFVMAAAIFPAYLLARMRRLAAAGRSSPQSATIAAPALSYAPILVEEPWAYPAATLALWLTVRAIDRPGRGSLALAFGACVLAVLIRSQLAALFGALAFGLLALGWRSDVDAALAHLVDAAGTGSARSCSASAALIAVVAFLGHRSNEWEVATTLWKGRMVEYGSWAGGAFAIGVGVLPAIALLAVLAVPRCGALATAASARSSSSRAAPSRASAWYAAIKGAYLSTRSRA